MGRAQWCDDALRLALAPPLHSANDSLLPAAVSEIVQQFGKFAHGRICNGEMRRVSAQMQC